MDTADEYILFVKPIHHALFEADERVQIVPVALTDRIQRII